MIKTKTKGPIDARWIDSSIFVSKDQVNAVRRRRNDFTYINLKDYILSRAKRNSLCSGWSGTQLDASYEIYLPKSVFSTKPTRNGSNKNIDLYAVIATLMSSASYCDNAAYDEKFQYTLDFLDDLNLPVKFDPTSKTRLFVDTGFKDVSEEISLGSIFDKYIFGYGADYTPSLVVTTNYDDPNAVSVVLEILDYEGNAITSGVGIKFYVNDVLSGSHAYDVDFSSIQRSTMNTNFGMSFSIYRKINNFIFSKNPTSDVGLAFPLEIYYEVTYTTPIGQEIVVTSDKEEIPVLAGGTR